MVQTKFAKTEDKLNGSVKIILTLNILNQNKVLLLIQENFSFNQQNVSSDILSDKNE